MPPFLAKGGRPSLARFDGGSVCENNEKNVFDFYNYIYIYIYVYVYMYM